MRYGFHRDTGESLIGMTEQAEQIGAGWPLMNLGR